MLTMKVQFFEPSDEQRMKNHGFPDKMNHIVTEMIRWQNVLH